MCNLYSITKAQDAMRELFEVAPEMDALGNLEPLPAVWPKWQAPVVRVTNDGRCELVRMNWGFLTKKVSKRTGKELKPAAYNNARDDKVQISGLWKDAFETKCCLVPATSFRETKGRTPATDYWFALSGDEPRPLFAFAGLWQTAPEPLAASVHEHTGLSHTVITTTVNEVVAQAHPERMPVILDPADYATWLNGSAADAFALLKPFPAERMQVVKRGVGILADGDTS